MNTLGWRIASVNSVACYKWISRVALFAEIKKRRPDKTWCHKKKLSRLLVGTRGGFFQGDEMVLEGNHLRWTVDAKIVQRILKFSCLDTLTLHDG